MSALPRFALMLAFVALVCGCAFERHYAIKPGVNQVVRVASGDRWFFELEENGTTGYQWTAESDDPDVEVTIEHRGPKDAKACGVPGVAKVTIRIHRGYDGPSVVSFAYRRNWERKPAKSFAISLYRNTGDDAFWE